MGDLVSSRWILKGMVKVVVSRKCWFGSVAGMRLLMNQFRGGSW